MPPAADLVAPKAPPPLPGVAGCPKADGWPNPDEAPKPPLNAPPGFAGCPNAPPPNGVLLCAGADAAPNGEADAAGALAKGEAAAEAAPMPPKTPPPLGAAAEAVPPKGVDGAAPAIAIKSQNSNAQTGSQQHRILSRFGSAPRLTVLDHHGMKHGKL